VFRVSHLTEEDLNSSGSASKGSKIRKKNKKKVVKRVTKRVVKKADDEPDGIVQLFEVEKEKEIDETENNV
jgi:GTP-binding protein EngB required for normal cell division